MSLRFAVLGLLAIHPASGYELAKHFETTLPQVWSARNNQLYAELAKLTEQGFAEITEEGPRGRRIYAVTSSGREELLRWLVEQKPDRRLRSETALRDFLTPTLSKKDAARVLQREIDYATEQLAEIDGLLARMAEIAPGDDDVRILATERRRYMTDARLNWARDALRRIAKRGR